jgi:hypothetical protein
MGIDVGIEMSSLDVVIAVPQYSCRRIDDRNM